MGPIYDFHVHEWKCAIHFCFFKLICVHTKVAWLSYRVFDAPSRATRWRGFARHNEMSISWFECSGERERKRDRNELLGFSAFPYEAPSPGLGVFGE
jgi:hypothetical protein